MQIPARSGHVTTHTTLFYLHSTRCGNYDQIQRVRGLRESRGADTKALRSYKLVRVFTACKQRSLNLTTVFLLEHMAQRLFFLGSFNTGRVGCLQGGSDADYFAHSEGWFREALTILPRHCVPSLLNWAII